MAALLSRAVGRGQTEQLMTGFNEIRFPTDVALGARGGPERRTDVVTLRSGAEQRNAIWADARRKYQAGYGVKSFAQLEAVLAFFEAQRGRLYGFRWKDRFDYRSCASPAAPAADRPGDRHRRRHDGDVPARQDLWRRARLPICGRSASRWRARVLVAVERHASCAPAPALRSTRRPGSSPSCPATSGGRRADHGRLRVRRAGALRHRLSRGGPRRISRPGRSPTSRSSRSGCRASFRDEGARHSLPPAARRRILRAGVHDAVPIAGA